HRLGRARPDEERRRLDAGPRAASAARADAGPVGGLLRDRPPADAPGRCAMTIRLKRAFEPAEPGDGTRVLVERLWPRGVSKERAAVDLWLKDVAPSPELRRWYSHDVAKWPEFRRRYREELREHEDEVAQ